MAPKVLIILYDGGEAARNQPKLLGTTENRLGMYDWLVEQGCTVVVTSDKEGPNSVFRKEIVDAEILITTPFHPGYLSKEIMDSAKNLKLCVTAGVGSDHIDLAAANERKITVAEVSGSNVVSVAEQVVMTMLNLVRNFVPAHEQIIQHGWNVADIAQDAYDLEGKVIGTIGCGRIGYRVLQRLEAFNPAELLWFDYTDLPADAASAISARRVATLDELLAQCDVVTVNCPLHEQTRGLINAERLAKMKKGAWLVNTARGAICDRMAVVNALESGHLNGYGGDVWDVQPAPADHPWRDMRNPLGGGNAMTAHYSGTTLDAQKRYAEGTKDIVDRYLHGKAQNPANVIVENGEYASKAYGQRNK